MRLCSCVFTLDFRGHGESGTFYAMQLVEENPSDLRVLEGGWINKNSKGNNFIVTIKLCCSGRECSLGIINQATLINSHSSEWQAAFTTSLEQLAQSTGTNLPVKPPCQKSPAQFPSDRYSSSRLMDRQTLLFPQLVYKYAENAAGTMFISILQ